MLPGVSATVERSRRRLRLGDVSRVPELPDASLAQPLVSAAGCETAHESESTNVAVQRREVIQAEALGWLQTHPATELDAVVTSLPDVSEMTGQDLGSWREWFIATVRLILNWIPEQGVAVFFQSDIRRGAHWVDKSYLVNRAGELEGATLLWHKIVCRRPAGVVAVGRPSYSHMLCLTRHPRGLPIRPGPDVLPDAGYMPWSRAMGVEACRVACQFLLDETPCRRVVDPFCGQGTVLAVANALGLEALGIDLGGKRCRLARNMKVELGRSGTTNRG